MKKQSQVLNETTLARLTEIFKALSDQNRVRILHLLNQGSASVNYISTTLDMTQSNVSHQLRTLKQAKLIKATRQGQSMIYEVDDHHVTDLLYQAIHHAKH